MPNQPGRGAARSRARAHVRRRSSRPVAEALEARRLLTTYVVTTTADLSDGLPAPGSLREAIELANANPGPDLIRFAIAGSNGPQTITIDDRLPDITDPVTIDGYSQPGSKPNTQVPLTGDNAVLNIAIDGSNAGITSNVDGLTLDTDGCVVRGLAIDNFLGSAIVVLGNNNVVAGNFLGVGLDGHSAMSNRDHGVLVNGSSGNTIGGAAAADRNLIGDNGLNGVRLFQGGSNVVRNNFVGVDATGVGPIGNGDDGIAVNQSPGNAILDNLIGDNFGGIFLVYETSAGNLIRGNFIGITPDGTRLANRDDGIADYGAPGNTIGGPAAADRNVISGNNQQGVSLRGPTATRNLVQGNLLGLSPDGQHVVGNLQNGLFLQNAPGNTIGGTIPGAGNISSGNNQAGLSLSYYPDQTLPVGFSRNLISGGFPDFNLVQGNFLGTGPNGNELGFGNVLEGIYLGSGQHNTIGGTAPGAGNVISGNNTDGLLIVGPTIPGMREGNDREASFNLVQGNKFGTDAAGTLAVRNLQHGIYLVLANDNTIGGTVAGAGNVISGNKGPGIQINGAIAGQVAATGNVVQGNLIGTDVTGMHKPLAPDGSGRGQGNLAEGVLIDSGAFANTIGGTGSPQRHLRQRHDGRNLRDRCPQQHRPGQPDRHRHHRPAAPRRRRLRRPLPRRHPE